jgi:hypothetical protein
MIRARAVRRSVALAREQIPPNFFRTPSAHVVLLAAARNGAPRLLRR